MTTDNTPPAGGADQRASGKSQPQHRSAQDQAIAAAISVAEQRLTKARDNPDIMALLAPRGYDLTALRGGLVLQGAARDTFNARPKALGKAAIAKETRDTAWKAAKEDYGDFRVTVQAVFKKDEAARKALGATGKVTDDLQKFVSQATASYTAARAEEFAALLATRGWNAARLTLALAALPTLLEFDNKFKVADSAATASTKERDAAHAALGGWMSEFNKIARLALKKYPEHRTALGL